MNSNTTPANVGSNDGLGLPECADKARALLFGLRDSDPGCTEITEWKRWLWMKEESPDERAQCHACCGKGWNDEFRAVAGHYCGGETFRIQCEACDGGGFSTLTPEFMQAQADEAPNLARGA